MTTKQTSKTKTAPKHAVPTHRAGSKRAKAHKIIVASGKRPRKEVLARICKLGVTKSTAATWYGSLRKMKYMEARS